LGDMLLTEKEATRLVIGDVSSSDAPRPRWAAVGKVCSPQKLVIGALERAMDRAWGLHRPAQFRDIGNNRFVVRFSSEGDWKHAMNNGPWQFDFSAVLLKDCAGSVRPSDMVFDTMEIWIRVYDLPMDMMNRLYGKLIGNWVGKFISVEVDQDGIAWGKELRIRVEVRVDQPLPRGVSMKEKGDDAEGTWFDLKYEKVPHFCFYCGCIMHPADGCTAERTEWKQWGEWLRASPRRNQRQQTTTRPSVSSSSYGSFSTGSDSRGRGGVSIRDIPTRRNLMRDETYSGSSRTGGHEQYYANRDEVSQDRRFSEHPSEQCRETGPLGAEAGSVRQGTFSRRTRNNPGSTLPVQSRVPMGTESRKRGAKQVWVLIPVQVVGDDEMRKGGKRQRKNSVFDRMEESTGDHGGLGNSESVFNRLEEPTGGRGERQQSSVFQRMEIPEADPAAQGRLEQ
jgi:hypothetical protein